MIKTEKFLELIHGVDARIFFNVGRSTWKAKPQTFKEAEPKLKWRNIEGDDICFIVNGGGTKDSEITRVNAVFIDWDAGRDDTGKYFTLDIVQNRKQEFRARLDSFSIHPSILVETRNGFHAYWLLEPGVSSEQFRNCQIRLAINFNSDQSVQNPARVMRLPGFDWSKPGSGCEPFHVEVVAFRETRFNLNEILEALGSSTGGEDPVIQKPSHHQYSTNIQGFEAVLDPPQVTTLLTSYSNGISYLKKQDLGVFLGLGPTASNTRKICCPFHEDKTSSASLTLNPVSGFWRFKCFSSRCGVSGSIIDLAMRRPESTTWNEAIQYLFGLYQIEIKTDWRQEQEALLEYNLSLLDDAELLAGYPSLFRIIRRVLPDLKTKIKLARAFLISDRLCHDGSALFFCSLRQFHQITSKKQEHPKYFNRQNQKVDRYCLLGLMKKLSDDEIPGEALKRARDIRTSRHFSHRIQFYSVPGYSTSVLQRADERARVLIEAGASVRGISRVMIRDLFGLQMAKEIYPQIEVAQASPAEEKLKEKIKTVVSESIASRGFCRILDIRQALANTREWKSVTERRIDRLLPGILRALRLRKIISNKEIKNSLGIEAVGYPAVIIPIDGPSG